MSWLEAGGGGTKGLRDWGHSIKSRAEKGDPGFREEIRGHEPGKVAAPGQV